MLLVQTMDGSRNLGDCKTTFDACIIAAFEGIQVIRLSGSDYVTGERFHSEERIVSELWEDVELELVFQ